MQSLQKGLIMHLENMAEDEEFFAISASDVHLSVVSILMKYFGQNRKWYNLVKFKCYCILVIQIDKLMVLFCNQ